MLLPAVYSSRSSFSSNTKHLLQLGNSHLKHLYSVLMNQEQHISITLCDVSNDFWHSPPALWSPEAAPLLVSTKQKRAASGDNREIVFVQRMLVRGGGDSV